MAGKQIPFRPKLEGDFNNRFYLAVSEITDSTSASDILEIAEEEIRWVENDCIYNIDQRRKSKPN